MEGRKTKRERREKEKGERKRREEKRREGEEGGGIRGRFPTLSTGRVFAGLRPRSRILMGRRHLVLLCRYPLPANPISCHPFAETYGRTMTSGNKGVQVLVGISIWYLSRRDETLDTEILGNFRRLSLTLFPNE